MTANHEPINSSRFHWEKSVNFSVERTEGKSCREQNTFSTRAALQMGSDFWKFSCRAALQHLIQFWWFERRDDNQGWHVLEGRQKFLSPKNNARLNTRGNKAFALFTLLPLVEMAGLSQVQPKCCFFFSNRSSLLHLIILQVFYSKKCQCLHLRERERETQRGPSFWKRQISISKHTIWLCLD